MQPIPQIEGADGSGSEPTSGSDDGQLAVVLRNMVEKQIQEAMPHTLPQLIRQAVIEQQAQLIRQAVSEQQAQLIRQAVKDELPSALEKFFLSGNLTNSNSVTAIGGRSLYLKFLDEVADEVLTGQEIIGKDDKAIRLAIFDEVTRQVVESGPASSTKVDISVLEASGNDKEDKLTDENFSSRVIEQSDKGKPHFVNGCQVFLEKGRATLCNAKLAHGSIWTKKLKCQLGAQAVGNLSGATVKKACTNSFMVSDKRVNAKRYPPSLSDEVWRLDHIVRGGGSCKRLKEKNISTIRDSLLLRPTDPHRLRKIIECGDAAWKGIDNHVQTCNIDGSTMFVFRDNPSELDRVVVFDIVEGMKGIISNHEYVQNDHLSKSVKENAEELLRSAFENQNHIKSYTEDMTHTLQLWKQLYDTATDVSMKEIIPVCSPIIPENIPCDFGSAELGASSQGTSQSIGPSSNATLMHQIPYQTGDTATNTSIQDGFHGHDPTVSKRIFYQYGSTSTCPSPSLPLNVDTLPDLVGSKERLCPVAPEASNPDMVVGEREPPLHLVPHGGGGGGGGAYTDTLQFWNQLYDTDVSMQEIISGCSPIIPENIPCDFGSAELGASSQGTSQSIGPSSNATLMHQIPYQTGDTATNTSIQDGFHGHDPTVSKRIFYQYGSTSTCPSPSLPLVVDTLPDLVGSKERLCPVAPEASNPDMVVGEREPPLHLVPHGGGGGGGGGFFDFPGTMYHYKRCDYRHVVKFVSWSSSRETKTYLTKGSFACMDSDMHRGQRWFA